MSDMMFTNWMPTEIRVDTKRCTSRCPIQANDACIARAENHSFGASPTARRVVESSRGVKKFQDSRPFHHSLRKNLQGSVFESLDSAISYQRSTNEFESCGINCDQRVCYNADNQGKQLVQANNIKKFFDPCFSLAKKTLMVPGTRKLLIFCNTPAIKN
jgi:hypothetical protein